MNLEETNYRMLLIVFLILKKIKIKCYFEVKENFFFLGCITGFFPLHFISFSIFPALEICSQNYVAYLNSYSSHTKAMQSLKSTLD